MKYKLKPKSPINFPLKEVRDFHIQGNAEIQAVVKKDDISDALSPEYPADLSQKTFDRFESYVLQAKPTSISNFVETRYSERSLKGPIKKSHLEKILGVLMGKAPKLRRPYPSAGAQYPCNIYFIIKRSSDFEPGVYYLNLSNGKLVKLFALSETQDDKLGIFEENLFDAAAYLVVTGQVFRTTQKYGIRGYRYCLMEAGIVGWQVNLVLEELGLQSVWIGGFDDDKLAQSLGIRPEIEQEYPLIILGIGSRKKS